MRTREAEKMVMDAFKHYHASKRDTANTTQFYSVANPLRGGEVRVDVYACRLTNRSRKPMVKCVQRSYSNKNEIDVRDVYRGYMGGFKVDFSDMTRQCAHYAERMFTEESLKRHPVGTWDSMKYAGVKTAFLLHGELLNDYKGTKYEHSGIERTHHHPLHFFDCYRISHAVEFLAKNGLSRFIRPAFIRRLRDDKAFFNFFRSRFTELKESWYGIKEFTTAFAHKCSFAEAEERIEASRAFAKDYYCHNSIPKSINRYELYKWCKKRHVQVNEYRRYVNYITNAGEDICAYGVTYPRNFRQALEQAEQRSYQADEARRNLARAQEEAENKRIENVMADMARKLAELNGITGYGYAVVIPKSAKMLITEGHKMKNCIGGMGYSRKIADGESLIFFLRGQDGRKNVDVEVAVRKVGDKVKLEVMQCYAAKNQPAPREAQKLAKELAKRAKKILFTRTRKAA